MSLEIKRQERDTNQGLIRRFSKRLKSSGVLLKARASAYRRRPKSQQMRKRAALRKIEKRKEYEKLAKLGKR